MSRINVKNVMFSKNHWQTQESFIKITQSIDLQIILQLKADKIDGRSKRSMLYLKYHASLVYRTTWSLFENLIELADFISGRKGSWAKLCCVDI